MADIRSQIAQLLDHPQEWVNTLWKGLVLKITKSTDAFLWDVFDLTNSQLKWIDFIENFQNIKNHNFLVFQNPRYNPLILIVNCSAHRPPIKMSLYFLESSGQELSIEHFCDFSVSWEISRERMCGIPPLWHRGDFYTMTNRFNLVFLMIKFEKKFINQ